jgi:MFS family permease
LGTPIIISYTKKHNHLRTTAFATVLYCIGFGLYAFVQVLPLYYVAVVIWSIGEIMISTGAGVFIAEHSPITHRARFQSLYDMARSSGRGFGPPVFGFMLMHITYRQAWIVDAIACLVIGAVMYLVYRFEKAKV